MKRPSIAVTLSLLASLLSSSAFALPPGEHASTGGIHAALIKQYKCVADNGPDRLVQQYQRVS